LQDNIGRTFRDEGPHAGTKVKQAVKKLKAGTIRVTDFPPLRVVRDDCHHDDQEGHYWSLDNRRLWVFNKAGLESCPVILLHPVTLEIAKELYDKTTTTTDGHTASLRSNKPTTTAGQSLSLSTSPSSVLVASIDVQPADCRSTEECVHDLLVVDTNGHAYRIPNVPAPHIVWLHKQHSLSLSLPLPHYHTLVT